MNDDLCRPWADAAARAAEILGWGVAAALLLAAALAR
jgi:hypothetical protein